MLRHGVARQEPAGAIEEDAQEVELGAGERNVPPLRVEHERGDGVGDIALESDRTPRAASARQASPGGPSPRPAGLAVADRTNAGDELARVERLAEIVVGPSSRTDDPVDVFLQGRQEDHGQRRPVVAQAAADVEAGAVGHHHVEHHEVDPPGGHGPLALARAGRQRDAEPLPLEIAPEELSDVGVVVDHQNRHATVRSLFGEPGPRGNHYATERKRQAARRRSDGVWRARSRRPKGRAREHDGRRERHLRPLWCAGSAGRAPWPFALGLSSHLESRAPPHLRSVGRASGKPSALDVACGEGNGVPGPFPFVPPADAPGRRLDRQSREVDGIMRKGALP